MAHFDFSSSRRRISRSCSAMPRAVLSKTHCAARTRLAAGAVASHMTRNKVVAAADEPCCRRPMACAKASLRASRNARRNSGLRCSRQSVTGDMPSAAAAFSCVPCSSKATIACSARRVSRRRRRLGVILASPFRLGLRHKLHRMFVHPLHAGRNLPCSVASGGRSRPHKEDPVQSNGPADQSSHTQ